MVLPIRFCKVLFKAPVSRVQNYGAEALEAVEEAVSASATASLIEPDPEREVKPRADYEAKRGYVSGVRSL
jgi:hypothetical protein